MISLFRKYLTSWFALGLFGLVLVAFAISGVGNTSFGGLTGGGDGVAAVGGTTISEAKLLGEFDRTLRRARATNPKLDARTAAREGAVGEVYEQLIATTAIEKFGQSTGVAISDRAVDGEIASVDAFRVNGQFDEPTYRRLLAAQRLSDRDLRDGLRGDLVRKQIVTPVISAAIVPRKLAEPYAALLLDRRAGSVATVPAAAMPAPAVPSAAQLATFYTAHAAAYTLPERRGFRYALIDREKLAAAAVSDAEIRKYFDANAATYGGDETRKLLQVVVPDAAKAKAIAAAVLGGTQFAAAAAKAGFAAADIDIGEQTKAKFAAATSAAVAVAAFALPSGGTSAPVQSPFGWHVVSVAGVTPARPRSFDAARAEISAKLKLERTDAVLSDTVGKIEDALSSRSSLADVAKRFGLTVAAVPPVTRTGTSPADPGFVIAPVAAPLVTKAFDADPADGPTLQQTAKTSFAIVEVGDIVPPAAVPLAKVHDAVVASYLTDARLVAAKAVAETIVAEVATGRPFASVVAAHQLPPVRPLAGRRVDLNTAAQVPPPVKLFLTLAAGTSRALPAGPQGYWIVHVDTVTPGDVATAPNLVDSARAQFVRAAPDEIGAAFAQAVARTVGVKRNANALAAATARITGTAKP